MHGPMYIRIKFAGISFSKFNLHELPIDTRERVVSTPIIYYITTVYLLYILFGVKHVLSYVSQIIYGKGYKLPVPVTARSKA
jgi:hypothetical protein